MPFSIWTIKEKLYGDYADEILTREDFLNYNELYSKRIEEYDRKITELEAERQNLQTAPNAYPFLDVYRKYRKLEEITRPMVVEGNLRGREIHYACSVQASGPARTAGTAGTN